MIPAVPALPRLATTSTATTPAASAAVSQRPFSRWLQPSSDTAVAATPAPDCKPCGQSASRSGADKARSSPEDTAEAQDDVQADDDAVDETVMEKPKDTENAEEAVTSVAAQGVVMQPKQTAEQAAALPTVPTPQPVVKAAARSHQAESAPADAGDVMPPLSEQAKATSKPGGPAVPVDSVPAAAPTTAASQPAPTVAPSATSLTPTSVLDVGAVSSPPPAPPSSANAADAQPVLAPPPPADGADGDPNTMRIARALQQAVSQRGGTVTLRMQPQDLGLVRVEMDLRAGNVQVVFRAEHASVRDLLNHDMAQLRHALERQGLTVQRMEVRDHADMGTASRQSMTQDQSASDGRSRGYQQRQSDDAQRRRGMLQRGPGTFADAFASRPT